MYFLKPATVLVALTAIAFPHTSVAHDYKDRPEKVEYRLSDDVRRRLDASDDLVQALNRQTFIFIDGTCRNPFVPCNCTFEGFTASCDFVLSCLESGLCVPDN